MNLRCTSEGEHQKVRKQVLFGAQILLGLAGSLLAYTTQASAQAATKRENMAVFTSIYLTSYNVDSVLGICASGGIWTQTLQKSLVSNLAFQTNTTLAIAVYSLPFEVVHSYPAGTSERSVIVTSYRHVQRVLCMTGIWLSTPMIALDFALRNPTLSAQQDQIEATSVHETNFMEKGLKVKMKVERI